MGICAAEHANEALIVDGRRRHILLEGLKFVALRPAMLFSIE